MATAPPRTAGRVAAVAATAIALGAQPSLSADRHTWTVEPEGITFELTRSDLRAWTGPLSAPPAFAVSALIAAEKKEFDEYAEVLARAHSGRDAGSSAMTTFDQSVTFEVLSIVGPLVSYRESGGGYAPGAAHPSGYDVLTVRDVRRTGATPSLLDYFPEAAIVAALKSDRWVRKFASPDSGFESATSLKDLLDALDPEWAQGNAEAGDHDCSVDVSFDERIFKHFSFHHVEKDRVAVRIAVPPGSEWCNRVGGPQQIGLLLPIPAALRAHVLGAQRGEAGFLAANRKAAGSPSFSDHWEVDVRTLARKP